MLYKKGNYIMEDKRTEQIPNNCNECNYTKTCIGHYGGSTCKYEGIIVDIALKKENKKCLKTKQNKILKQ